MIASPELLATRVVHHPFKFESHRLGSERSEDAVSWNVFRSWQQAGLLHLIGEQITGTASGIEPDLYLWGLHLNDDSLEPWQLLIKARERFENKLPVERPLTEPDIALHLPGKYLILIEAKFTSPNSAYVRGPRKDRSSLTLDELLEIYSDPDLKLLNRREAHSRSRVFYQLWRNTTFAEWMARLDHPKTQAFHVNLVREDAETESCHEFQGLVNPGFRDRFQRWTWEDLYQLAIDQPRLQHLRRYLETKTAGLTRAFKCLGAAERRL